MSDTKVRGRRCSAPCKCGKRLLIDGRRVRKAPPQPAAIARIRLKRTVGRAGRPSDPPTLRQITPTPPPLADGPPQANTQEPDSTPPSSAPRSLRPTAPTETTIAPEAGLPDEPGDLGEAIALLEARLDRAAESFRPTWEEPDSEPGSQQITPTGEVPEVTVHYPQNWQPPPSERLKKRKEWGGAPQNVVASTAQPAPRAASAVTTPSPVTRSVPESSLPSTAAHDSLPPPPPKTEKLDSTAPTASSHYPPPPTHSSRGAWFAVAGLAALALMAVGLRMNSKQPTDTTLAQPLKAPDATTTTKTGTPGSETPPATDARNTAASNENAGASVERLVETPAAEPTGALEPQSEAEEARAERQARAEDEAQSQATRADGEPRRSHARANDEEAKTPEREPSVAPPSAAAGLDPERVRAPLVAAAARARACATPEGPHGTGTVRILFNPEGGVLNATVLSAPFAGSPTGACIERAFRGAATPSFSGRTQSTNYRFLLP